MHADHVHSHNQKVQHSQKECSPLIEKKLENLRKISAIALCVFAAYISLELFVPFFFVGMAIGVYQHKKDKEICDHDHPSSSSCGSGLFERLTKTKLPPLVSLGADYALTLAHIDHLSNIMVPIQGISCGNWIGEELASNYDGNRLRQQLSDFYAKTLQWSKA